MKNTATPGNRAAELTELLAEAPKADDHDGVREYLRAMAGLGCAPLLVYPASKKPSDVRTPRNRRTEDKAAREAARAAGHPKPDSVKSAAGVHLASADTSTLDRYLDRYVEIFGDAVEVNIALSLGRSRLVVVDCDTAAQLAAFLADAEADPGTSPTVRTPGMLGPDGVTMVHDDGGHFYFTVPKGVELPPGPPGSMKIGGDEGYSVLWGTGNYALTPPSARPEGTYSATGEPVYELPGWLAEAITAHGRTYAEAAQRSSARADTAGDPVAQWGAGVPWSAILEPAGWTPVGKADGCGCPTWTAPGVHGNPKSATAHEPGCAKWTDSPDPPLHVWTDNPGEPWDDHIAATGRPTFSKLQAVALLHYGGREGAAMDALGIDATNTDALALTDAAEVVFLDNYRKPTPPGGAAAQLEGQALHEHLTLPDEYWQAHPALQHVRAAARATRNSPDGVLGAVHAEISAALHPRCRINTGVRDSSPLNAYVVLCDDQGGGKTSAQREAQSLLDVTATDTDDPFACDDDETGRVYRIDRTVFRAGGFGSGEGIPAQYVEFLPVDPLKPKGRKHNVQVRSNVLFSVDEGESVKVELVDKAASKFGENFRKAWAGADLGEGNAHAETRRRVPGGQYVIGASIGMQTPTLRDLLNDRQHRFGTVPRLDCYWMPDPGAPDVRPPHPGPLTLDLSLFNRPLTFCDELLAELDAKAVAITRGVIAADQDRHRELSICRRAARLWVLCVGSGLGDPVDDPYTIPRAFYELAEIEYERSARIKAHAEALTRDARTRDAEARNKAEAARAVAVDEARRVTRVGREERIAGRIIRFLDKHGPTPWTGKAGLWQRAKDKNDDRAEWERVRDGLVDDERLVLDGGVYALADVGERSAS